MTSDLTTKIKEQEQKHLEEQRLSNFQSHIDSFAMAMSNFERVNQVFENSVQQPQILDSEEKQNYIHELRRLKETVEFNMDNVLTASAYFLLVGQDYRKEMIEKGIKGHIDHPFLLGDIVENDSELYETLMYKYITAGLEIIDTSFKRLREWEPKAKRFRNNDFFVNETGDRSGYTATNILDRMAFWLWRAFYKKIEIIPVTSKVRDIWEKGERNPVIREAQIMNILDGTDETFFPEHLVDLSEFSNEEIEAVRTKLAANQALRQKEPQPQDVDHAQPSQNDMDDQTNVIQLFAPRPQR